MVKSIWSDTVRLPEFPSMEGDRQTDILIIGGGMAGILCGYFLKQKGVDYMIVEGNRIGSGMTKNTTAKITVQHGFMYASLIKRFGKEGAEKYLASQQDALEVYARICKEAAEKKQDDLAQNYAFDFEWKNNYAYTIGEKKRLEKEMQALEALHISKNAPVYVEGGQMPLSAATGSKIPYDGAVMFPHQAQFHPLKFLGYVAKDLNIYENTYVWEMIGTKAVTNNGSITAKKVICTTHFPQINKHGSYFLKMYQERSYVIALKNAVQVDGMYIDASRKGALYWSEKKQLAKDNACFGLSFRNTQDFLLLGGNAHRTGKKCSSKRNASHKDSCCQEIGWEELRRFAKMHYPTAEEVYHWANQDCMTLDELPYIGAYSKGTKDFYVATGFHKWGMTSSMVAAKILADMVAENKEKDNRYADIYSPSRSMLRPQLLFNGLEAGKSLLTPAKHRCPHLGCALKWNAAEHSWDCPCHGSRFAKDGKLLNGPATGDLP